MDTFSDQASYEAWIDANCPLPRGFRVASSSLTFVPDERPTLEPYRMNLSLMLMDEPTNAFAGMCTRNRVVGAPVLVARDILSGQSAQGVIVNNRIANVCAPNGLSDARRIQQAAARAAGCDSSLLFPVSTGIIGWKLPVDPMIATIPAVFEKLASGTPRDFATGIMTTDRYPKVVSIRVGEGSILGIAKGAGMVEPDLATMLVFVMTDLRVDREMLRRVFSRAVDASFNRISIDSDQSTSDMALMFSSGRVNGVDESLFARGLESVCQSLARQIVRNGEGTAHVMQVKVCGLSDEASCRAVGKAIVNSPLVKTAVYGNDPNVGRIVGAIGNHLSKAAPETNIDALSVRIADELVFSEGSFRLDREKEITLSSYLSRAAMNPRVRGYPQHDVCVDISVDFGTGQAESVVWGSDLSDEYVHENADYRT